MRIGHLIVCLFALILTSPVFAFTKYDRIAIQGTLAAHGGSGGATTGIGIVDYGRWFELGMNLSGEVSSGPDQTRLFIPVAFGGLRTHLFECIYLAGGINYSSKIGKQNGYHIKNDFTTGPYIGIEYLLAHHLLLVGFINPYSYEKERINGSTIVRQQFFNTGGIALSFLFDHFRIPIIE